MGVLLVSRPLPRSATVVRHLGDVSQRPHFQSGCVEGANRGLATASWAAHEDVYGLHAVGLGPFGRLLGAQLGREGSALARALEAYVAAARPAKGVALGVGDVDDRVVEGGVNVRQAVGDLSLLLLFASGCCFACHGLLRLLLACDGLRLAFAGPCVGPSVLAPGGKAATMADPSVGVDLDQSANVGVDVPPKVALDLVVLVNDLSELGDLVVVQVADLRPCVYPGLFDDLAGPFGADPEDALETDEDALVAREVNASDTCHGLTLASACASG